LNKIVAAGVAVSLAASPATACTDIMLKTKDGAIVHGRTVEFGIFIESQVVLVPRGYEFAGDTPGGRARNGIACPKAYCRREAA